MCAHLEPALALIWVLHFHCPTSRQTNIHFERNLLKSNGDRECFTMPKELEWTPELSSAKARSCIDDCYDSVSVLLQFMI